MLKVGISVFFPLLLKVIVSFSFPWVEQDLCLRNQRPNTGPSTSKLITFIRWQERHWGWWSQNPEDRPPSTRCRSNSTLGSPSSNTSKSSLSYIGLWGLLRSWQQLWLVLHGSLCTMHRQSRGMCPQSCDHVCQQNSALQNKSQVPAVNRNISQYFTLK